MHRLTRRDLSSRIFVAVVTAPPTVQRGLVSKNQQAREEARKRLVDIICDLIDGRGVCVVQADQVRIPSADIGCGIRPGVFGKDEDWPAELAFGDAEDMHDSERR